MKKVSHILGLVILAASVNVARAEHESGAREEPQVTTVRLALVPAIFLAHPQVQAALATARGDERQLMLSEVRETTLPSQPDIAYLQASVQAFGGDTIDTVGTIYAKATSRSFGRGMSIEISDIRFARRPRP